MFIGAKSQDTDFLKKLFGLVFSTALNTVAPNAQWGKTKQKKKMRLEELIFSTPSFRQWPVSPAVSRPPMNF